MHKVVSKVAGAARHTLEAARRHVVATGVVAALLTGSLGAGAAFALSSRPAAAAGSAVSAAKGDDLAATAAAGRGHLREAFAFRVLVRLVATDTNQTPKAVIDQLRAGKSLDQIAGSKAASIRQQVLDRLKARLAKAVSAHKITQAQADQRLARWTTRLEKVMSTPGTQLPIKRLHPGSAPTSA